MSATVTCETCGQNYLTYCYECAFRDAIRNAVNDELEHLSRERMLTIAAAEIVEP